MHFFFIFLGRDVRHGQGVEGTGILPRELRFAAKWLYELCFWFSMPDETVATRPPWLDSSLPRLPCRCISGFLGHNSTVSKQLRYALSRECTRHLRRRAAFAHASHISWLQYYATSGNIKIFKIRKIKMPESGGSNADLRPHKNRRTTLQMPV